MNNPPYDTGKVKIGLTYTPPPPHPTPAHTHVSKLAATSGNSSYGDADDINQV